MRTILKNKPATEDVVAADAVTVTFGDVTALDRVSFTISTGQRVALMGPNGSGKTTLLHCLAGLRRPTGGTVEVDTAEGPVAYMRQRHEEHTWMPLTAEEVIRMGRYRRRGFTGRLRADDRRRVRALAERLEVTAFLGRQFGVLSGGQQQRVLFAQALAQDPGVLLLDEPVTGLDLASQRRIFELVAEVAAAGVTVVLSTHHLDEARRCDEVLLLDHSVVAAGPPPEVLTADNLERAFAGRTLHPHTEGEPVELLDEHGHGTHNEPPTTPEGP